MSILRKVPTKGSTLRLESGKRSASNTRAAADLKPAQEEDERGVEASAAPLDQDVKSRERVLALLNEKLPKDGQSQQLIDQLAVRDARLEELQARILSLEAEAKIGQGETVAMRNRQIQGLQEERDSLLSTVQGLEATNKAIEHEVSAKVAKLTEEKDNAEAVAEGLTEELEVTKAKLKAKDDQTAGMKQDLVQLSRIVQEMSKLNSDLNEKVSEMNKDLETKNAEHYTATVKAQHTEQLEAALTAEMTKTQNMEKKVAKMTEDKAKFDALEEVSRASQEALRVLEEEMNKVDHAQIREFLESVQKVRHELKKSTAPPRAQKDDPSVLKETIKQLQAANAALESDQKRLISIENVHLDRIRTLEQEKDKMKAEVSEGHERLQKKVKLLQDSMDKFRARTEKAEEAYETAESEYQRAQTQLAAVQSKLQTLKADKKDRAANEDRLETAVKDLKSQLAAFKGQQSSQSMSLMNREMKMKQAAARLKSLSDEVWKKETEILRKEGQRLKLEQEVKVLKDSLQQAQTSAKLKAAGDLSAIESKLEEKDREISILKDMLRSTSHQVKHRDLDISRIKMKLEGATGQSTESSASPDITERSGKIISFVLELDSILSVKEKVTAGQKLTQGALKKRLRVDILPGDSEGVLQLVRKRIELLVEELQRESRSKADLVIHSRSLGEKLLSDAIRALSFEETSYRVADLVLKLKQLAGFSP